MDVYLLAKALHIVSFTAWMAGLFYLPRLFVYHTRLAPADGAYAMFVTMETKLLRLIMTPAATTTWALGLFLAFYRFAPADMPLWLWLKIALVALMSVFHWRCAQWRAAFEAGENVRNERFYRLVNEVPTVLLLGIVFLVILQPWG